MSKKAWIILLVAIGVGLAIVLGVLANSQSVAQKRYCSALDGLESSVAVVASSNPSSTQDQLQNQISGVQQAWGDVTSAASHLSDVNQKSLDQAWSGFQHAIDTAGSGSQQTVVAAAQTLQSASQSSIDSYDCSDSSS